MSKNLFLLALTMMSGQVYGVTYEQLAEQTCFGLKRNFYYSALIALKIVNKDTEIRLNAPGIDLSGADLFGINFKGSNLKGANFANSNLQYTDFSLADLRNAKFNTAQFMGAVIKGADFRGADLTGAHFDDTTLTNSIF